MMRQHGNGYPGQPDQAPTSPTSNREQLEPNGSLRRRGSFSFLRRSKSRERSVSGSSAPQRKLSKKASKKMREEEMRRMHEQIPQRPPRIPAVPSQPEMETFGGGDTRPDIATVMSNRAAGSFPQRLTQKTSQENIGSNYYYRGMPIPPVPPIPPMPGYIPAQGQFVDQNEGMANRGRYSYASSVISTINSPRKLRRRKDPTPFNILIIGARGSGKTSFINFLQSSLALPLRKRRQSTQSVRDEFENPAAASEAAFPSFTSHSVETEYGGERVGVTLWDSEGFEKHGVDVQLKETIAFIEAKFEDTFTEESKVARAPGFRDTHIHCVFMVLDPSRLDANIAADQKRKLVNGGKARANSFVKARPERTPIGLDDEIDLNVLRALKGKTTVVPIISKADTITTAHITHLKRAVWESLKQNGLDTLEALEKEDEDSESDTSTEHDAGNLDERDEDRHNAKVGASENLHINGHDPNKFSMTSHLASSSSSSSFTSADFDLAKPDKPSRNADPRRLSSPEAITPIADHLLPLSIISPDPYEPEVVGRKFAWGFADPVNADHCDFTKLKQKVFAEWRGDLREASRELWYEGWRTNRMNRKSKRHAMSLGMNEVQTTVWAGQGQGPMHPNQPWMQ